MLARKDCHLIQINQTEKTEIAIYLIALLPEVFFMVGRSLKKLM